MFCLLRYKNSDELYYKSADSKRNKMNYFVREQGVITVSMTNDFVVLQSGSVL